MNHATITQRDAIIDAVAARMQSDAQVIFLTADLGAPALDGLRGRFPERCLNVGIAEQNLVNVAAGMALEGCKVVAYALAPFLAPRAYEQIRNNLALLHGYRPLHVNLLAAGAGLSSALAGSSHHCLDDFMLMRSLPNVELISPGDNATALRHLEDSWERPGIRYFRLDGQPLPPLYADPASVPIRSGFAELCRGEEACIVATGIMTHTALAAAGQVSSAGRGCGVIDVFNLTGPVISELTDALAGYRVVLCLAEGRPGGGLDEIVGRALAGRRGPLSCQSLGFAVADHLPGRARSELHRSRGLDKAAVAEVIMRLHQAG